MTTTTAPAPTTAAPGRGLLRGLPWVVWRRHRTFLRAALLLTVIGCALFLYQRMGVMDFLHGKGAPPEGNEKLLTEFRSRFGSTLESDMEYLRYVPFVVGVFLGAPLIAREQEHGTLKLVTTQSVSRSRWLAATLGLPLAVAVACSALLSAVFTWVWTPVHGMDVNGDWLTGGAFESTGPVPAARALFLAACGIALGMLIKRVVPAMAATAFVALATSVVWERFRGELGAVRSITYPYNGDGPNLPFDAARFDDWVATADGRLYGFGTCVSTDSGADHACRAKLGIVNRVIQYFDYEQMAGMQWLGAAVLVALAAVVLAFVVWRTRRRPL
ncbi:ABC transporter permease subunit [Streptomyces endophytica]|uniref:ABC transporter permease n=1 Tax=Streptomyces endophytica TaxID=2991496 RepID=A0ABY6PC81_9ACTN|nr:ABC transporter permease subunit [Streptomyces endophytica]UZJ30970.1 ABC transporter permease [Streptomyces endophytica]